MRYGTLFLYLFLICKYKYSLQFDLRSLLLIGDSNDRNIVTYFCDNEQGEGSNYGGNDFVAYNSKWDSRDLHWTPNSFLPNKTVNWSDLKCITELKKMQTLIYSHQIRQAEMNYTDNYQADNHHNEDQTASPQNPSSSNLFSLYLITVFGSSDKEPYHLGMCDPNFKADEGLNLYCDTGARIPRAIEVLRSKFEPIDAIVFQAVLWDLNFLTPQEHMVNIEKRVKQIQDLVPSDTCLVLRTVPINPAMPEV